MTAEFDEELISASLDGEVTADEQAVVDRRLAEFSALAQQRDDFQKMGEWLRDLPRESAPAGLRAAIREQIAQEHSAAANVPLVSPKVRPVRTHYPLAVYFSSAAALVVLISAVGYYQLAERWMGSMADKQSENLIIAANEPVRVPEVREMLAPATADRMQNDRESIDSHAVLAEPLKEEAGPAPLMAPAASPLGLESLSDAVRPKQSLSLQIPAPPMMARTSPEEALKRLNASPKISGQLEPGELVRYITAQDGQVAVVELSVVDVSRSFGEIQVLLTANQIVPSSPERFETKTMSEGNEIAEVEKKNAGTAPALALKSELDDLRANVASPMPLQPAESGLVALYVEASEDQFLQALNQLETLAAVKSVHLGEAPRMGSSVYTVVPIEQESEAESESRLASEKPQTPPTEGASGGMIFSLAQTEATEQTRSLWRGRMSHPAAEGESRTQLGFAPQAKGTVPAESAADKETPPAIDPAQRLQMSKNSLVATEQLKNDSSYQVPLRLLPLAEQAPAEEDLEPSLFIDEKDKATTPRVRVLLILSQAEGTEN